MNKRHWRTTGVVSVVVVLGAAAWWQGSGRRSALALMQAPPNYDPVSRVERDAVRKVLEQLTLDRDALIALNLNSEQAVSVLGTVRTWQENNAATLRSLKHSIDEAVTDVRQIKKAIAMGPFEAGREQALAVARGDLADAQAASEQALSPLRSSVSALLSESQRTTWRAIQSGHGQTMPVRMLDLTDEQRLAVSKATRGYRRQRAAASSSQERAATVTARDNAMAQTFTVDQQAVLSAYHSNYQAASEVVADALGTVLELDEG